MRKLAFAVASGLALTLAAAALVQQTGFAQQTILAQKHDPAKHDPSMHDAMSHAKSSADAADPKSPLPADMSPIPTDGRQFVNFPPEVRAHQMKNMREHLQAVSDILEALGAGRYDNAAGFARTRLGVDSAAAGGCKGAAATAGGENAASHNPNHDASGHDMHQMLARHMPEGMSRLGMTMHHAADSFADAAEAAGKSGDPKPAYAALAKVTSGCVGCHEAYRTQ